MTRPQEFATNDIGLSAALMTALNARPIIRPGNRLVEFVFQDSEQIRDASAEYAAGRLLLDAKRLDSLRARLFKVMAEVSRSGREVIL